MAVIKNNKVFFFFDFINLQIFLYYLYLFSRKKQTTEKIETNWKVASIWRSVEKKQTSNAKRTTVPIVRRIVNCHRPINLSGPSTFCQYHQSEFGFHRNESLLCPFSQRSKCWIIIIMSNYITNWEKLNETLLNKINSFYIDIDFI